MARTDGGLSDRVKRALEQIGKEARLTPVLATRLLEIAEGKSYEEIARWHDISINTVKTEARILLESLRIRARCQIEDAARAAELRAERGAEPEEIHAFLRLRFE